MLTREKIIAKLEQEKEQIRKFGVDKLFLVGSFARNEATAKSDIDFLVEFKTNRGLFDDYTGLLHFLESLFDKKIDLIKKSLVREELKENILRGQKIEAKV